MKVIGSDGSSLTSGSDVIQPVPIKPVNDRIKPRQTGTGVMRGQQTILGEQQSKIVFGLVPGSTDDLGISFYDANGIPRWQVGDYPDGTVKMKLSQTGQDVRTATDDQLVWSSDFNLFKIVSSGTATSVVSSLAAGATDTTTVAHNLGYIPAVMAFVNGTGSTYLTADTYYPLPKAVPITVGANVHPGITYEVRVDASNVYFDVTNWSTVGPITDIGTANWKYYLLRETAN